MQVALREKALGESARDLSTFARGCRFIHTYTHTHTHTHTRTHTHACIHACMYVLIDRQTDRQISKCMNDHGSAGRQVKITVGLRDACMSHMPYMHAVCRVCLVCLHSLAKAWAKRRLHVSYALYECRICLICPPSIANAWQQSTNSAPSFVLRTPRFSLA